MNVRQARPRHRSCWPFALGMLGLSGAFGLRNQAEAAPTITVFGKGVQALIKALEVLETSPAPPSARPSRAASADALAAVQTAEGGGPQALGRAPLVSLRGAALHALATLVAFSAALEAAGAALASATNGIASMRNALEAVFAVASAGLGAVLDRFASEPSGALAATFFAGSAAGAVSMIVVLSLGWVVVRGLRC